MVLLFLALMEKKKMLKKLGKRFHTIKRIASNVLFVKTTTRKFQRAFNGQPWVFIQYMVFNQNMKCFIIQNLR